MKEKIGKRKVAAVIVAVTLFALLQPVHAQPGNFTLTTRPDRASYVPGDSGTLTITIINTSTAVIQLNNLTVYFPWAGFGPDGKWQGNQSATYSNTFIAAPGGTSSAVFSATFQFSTPSWYGVPNPGPSGCGGQSTTRYGLLTSCVVVGWNSPTGRYALEDFTGLIVMAQATYTPVSLVSQAIPIATLVVLLIATAFLALLWTSTRRAAKK